MSSISEQIIHFTGTKWLVALDESPNSESAFDFALQKMDRNKDILVLVTVAEKLFHTLPQLFLVQKSDTALEAQHSVDDHCKDVLRKHWDVAREHGVGTIELFLGNSKNAGEQICRAAQDTKSDCICVGRRGLGKIKRLLLGSVSRYVVEHALCDVIVVKGEYGPDFAHDATTADVSRVEETERQRRISEKNAEDSAVQKQEKADSAYDRKVARCAEEQEQRSRIWELDEQHKIEQRQREDDLQKVRNAEEEERTRRMQGDAHFMPMPFPKVRFLHD
jgi:nucleotide-binding universal stress UspA family protein